MAAAPAPLSASAVPGSLSAEDRAVVADGFNALRNVEAAPPASGLRIVDLLDSRFMFTVSHPRSLNAAALRALALKLKSVRNITLDLPRAAVRVECWRAAHASSSTPAAAQTRGRKRKRGAAAPLLALPEDLDALLTAAARPDDVRALREIVLWVLRRDEEFCVFDLQVRRDEAQNAYTLVMGEFDAVSDTFLLDLCDQWRTLVRDAHVDWATQSVVVHVRM